MKKTYIHKVEFTEEEKAFIKNLIEFYYTTDTFSSTHDFMDFLDGVAEMENNSWDFKDLEVKIQLEE